jgi:hypothetical protein
MAACEDFFYEMYINVKERGISEAFYKQLDKMKFQDKHKYKTIRDHWEYAFDKITNENANKREKSL